jgi:MFS family permease
MKNHRFLFLWLASLCSGFALPMYLLAEQWYVVKELQLHVYVGWVMMATTLPRVILMLFGGVVADRFSQSKIMLTTNLARALLILIMVGLLWNQQLSFGVLLFFAVLFGIIDAFFWPASESIIPILVEKEQIVIANSCIQTTNQLSTMLGPLLAGLILHQFDFVNIFACCAGILLLASGFVMRICEQKEAEQKQQGLSVFEQVKEGVQLMKDDPFLLQLLSVLIMVNFFISGPVAIGIPLVANDVLHGNSLDLSYLQSAFGFGAIAGAILVGVCNFQKKRGKILCLALIVISLLIFLLGTITATWVGSLLLLLIGIMTTLINIPLISLIQEKVATDKMGRVMSLVMTLSIGLLPFSYAVCSSLLLLGLSVQQMFFLSGLVVGLYTLFVIWRFTEMKCLD